MLSRSGAKIGVLVPFTNVNLEPDMQLLCPEGCTMHFERLGGYDADEIPGAGQMSGLGSSNLDNILRLISGVRPKAILYGCTSATLTHGVEFDRTLASNIATSCGSHSITAAGSLINALRALNVTRIGFASPYVGEINRLAMNFLASENITTVSHHEIEHELDNYGQGELTPAEVLELALKADHPEAEAIVLSCTDMRAVEAIAEIESATDKLVVTSNQAMIFELCQKLELPRPAIEAGQLFNKL